MVKSSFAETGKQGRRATARADRQQKRLGWYVLPAAARRDQKWSREAGNHSGPARQAGPTSRQQDGANARAKKHRYTFLLTELTGSPRAAS